ncbi:ATP-binding protein [Candidatus Venteria ishoeyi]|uniref:Sensory/regulatory protein RpfC n=1 Tax=Candidatus Venteria ishoeyi TaxID=1899563 RepID=A0A1H6F8I4_9GAMM|nr:ATP-binding protein [Candidatus Venteria ishoeyi]SEH05629.1 Signal transduction histidine-protein kinase BarA [Candidatus Venteria ishoeyi]SEH07497.1 Signal transduction histidine-protein kinase BarA [Candidatus Venteria ishoeyi]
MKLQSKILLAVFPLIVIPLFILGTIAYQRLQQTATDTLVAQMQTLLQQTAQQVHSFEQTAKANARLFAASQMIHGYLLADEEERYNLLQLPLLKLFTSYQQAYPEYIEIRVILPDGYEDARFAIPELPNLTEEEADSAYFQHWLEHPQTLYLNYLHNPDNQEYSLQVAQRLQFINPSIQERNNQQHTAKLRAFLVITVRLDYLWQQAKQNKVGKQGQLFFTDAKGQILFHAQPEKVGKQLPDALSQMMPDKGEVQQHGATGLYYQGLRLNPDLWAFAVLPEVEFLAESQRLGFAVAAITLITIIFTLLLLMLLLNHLLIKPIKDLGKAAQSLSQGDLDAQLLVHSRDEMGLLTQRFNRMAQYLKTAQEQKDQAQAEALENKEQAIENLKQADRLKDEFLANTSHELRTPLNAIIGIGQSLLDGIGGKPSEVQAQNLRMIVQSGKRLSNLVNDILDAFKMRTKELQLQRSSVDLYTISSLTLELSLTLVAGKSVKLLNEVPKNLPPVDADENRLQQILLNLIGNAIKFTHEGQIIVSASVDKQGFMAVRVQDTGIGIAKDQQKTIFDAFEQGDGSTAREYGGTGLGLSVTQQLVELHGGKIQVESVVEQGSCFIFTLPLSSENLSKSPKLPTIAAEISPADNIELAEVESVQHYAILNCEPGDEQEQCRVLIVDDEPVNLHVLVNYLSMHHYQLTLASSGPEALNLLESGYEPDIIILDVMMPRMTGFEVTHIIRNTWQLHELPILLLTAKNQAQDIVTGLEAGANDYLVKPIAREELLARIRTHLSIKRLKAAREAALETARLKSEFLANMSHEIRTPMNAIIGVSELLSNSSLNAEQIDYVATIRTGSETLLALINDILDFSKIEAGKLDLETKPFYLRNCIEESLDLVRGIANKKAINLSYWIDWQVPTQLVGDITRLRQTLVNLLNNAVKFTKEGDVFVKVTAQLSDQNEDENEDGTPPVYQFKFAISDTGTGIPKERLGRLFQSFSQIDSSITRRYGGTGLGLAICKRLIELMQGEIWVESEIQKGSTFHFTISCPAILKPNILQDWEQQQTFTEYNFLIVEENTHNQEIFTNLLSHWGAKFQFIEKNHFLQMPIKTLKADCAIISLPMTNPKSSLFLEQLQTLQQQITFPLILITPVCRAPLLNDLFQHCLVKPIRPARLYQFLTQLLKSSTDTDTSQEKTASALDRVKINTNLRILLAEDNLVNQKVAQLVLKRLQLSTDITNNGEEALKALQEKSYDLVFMDIQMPEMDGLTATREIYKQFPAEKIPWIIAMTANAMENDQQNCLDAGMHDYLSKPVRIEKLTEALARFQTERLPHS